MINYFQKKFRKFLLILSEKTKESEYAFVPLGLLFFFGYTGWFFLWYYLDIQAYENLTLRLIGSLIGIPLIFHKHWPIKLKPLLPIYWYLSLFYLIPFFFTFMLLKNNFSPAWQMNYLTALVLLILVTDWTSLAILTLTGGLLSWIVYILTTQPHYSFPSMIGAIANYLAVILFCGLFMSKKSKLQSEKIQTIKAIGASVAHELRTPLRTIISAAHGIKKYFPSLLEGYQLAKKAHLPVQYISPGTLEVLLTACDDIESEAQAAFTVINILLINVTQSVETHEFKTTSIERCIDETLRRYPFDIDEAQLVHWRHGNEFLFNGNELLIIHVLFNLLKNALYQIKAVGKGEIQIWTECDKKYNLLHFKDTAKGISPKILAHIFDRFFSKTYHGTGIGLAFCRIVMENLGGKIDCKSVEGEYAEFILYFPNEPGLLRSAGNDEFGTAM